ncbi:restriction endonuclease subunit S [Streptomyces kronopolitis]|uniref:restriction endonuclease subunit S n=1 Tax=Streptomyces kronopolitis TaxID=1612435 RepID=UPI00367D4B7C
MSVFVHRMLGDMIVEAKPGFACGEEDPDGIFQMRMNNITRSGGLDLSKKRYVPSGHKSAANTLLCSGDVLFNATNSPDLVGKTLLFPGLDEPTVFSNHFLRLRTDGEQLAPAYLAHWLQEQFQRGVFKSKCRQWVNQATVGRESLLSISLPVPSLAVQYDIVSVLDHVEALRAKRRQGISLLDDLARSTFLDMFGTPDQAWAHVTVKDVAKDIKGSIRTGPFGSQLLHEEFVDSGIPVLGIDNAVTNEFAWQARRFITEEKYQKLERYRVHPGDVLITIMGTCGRCAVVPDDIPIAINTKHLCCITLDRSKCLPEFLHSYFLVHPISREYLRRTAKGAIMAGLNMGLIKDLPIVLPPISAQQAFVDRANSARKVKASHMAHLVELDALFRSLQHRAFRGEQWRDAASLAC